MARELEEVVQTLRLQRGDPFFDSFEADKLVITGTGFYHRQYIRQICCIVGLQYSGTLVKDFSTILVVNNHQREHLDPDSNKVKRALEWKIPVVSLRWLLDSIDYGSPLPVDAYVLISPPPQQPAIASNEKPSTTSSSRRKPTVVHKRPSPVARHIEKPQERTPLQPAALNTMMRQMSISPCPILQSFHKEKGSPEQSEQGERSSSPMNLSSPEYNNPCVSQCRPMNDSEDSGNEQQQQQDSPMAVSPLLPSLQEEPTLAPSESAIVVVEEQERKESQLELPPTEIQHPNIAAAVSQSPLSLVSSPDEEIVQDTATNTRDNESYYQPGDEYIPADWTPSTNSPSHQQREEEVAESVDDDDIIVEGVSPVADYVPTMHESPTIPSPVEEEDQAPVLYQPTQLDEDDRDSTRSGRPTSANSSVQLDIEKSVMMASTINRQGSQSPLSFCAGDAYSSPLVQHDDDGEITAAGASTGSVSVAVNKDTTTTTSTASQESDDAIRNWSDDEEDGCIATPASASIAQPDVYIPTGLTQLAHPVIARPNNRLNAFSSSDENIQLGKVLQRAPRGNTVKEFHALKAAAAKGIQFVEQLTVLDKGLTLSTKEKKNAIYVLPPPDDVLPAEQDTSKTAERWLGEVQTIYKLIDDWYVEYTRFYTANQAERCAAVANISSFTLPPGFNRSNELLKSCIREHCLLDEIEGTTVVRKVKSNGAVLQLRGRSTAGSYCWRTTVDSESWTLLADKTSVPASSSFIESVVMEPVSE